MKRSMVVLNRTIFHISPLLAVAIATYSIWYCQAALEPFSEARRMAILEERTRLALFQTESLERGYLLTNDVGSLAMYEATKLELRLESGLLAESAHGSREREIVHEVQFLVNLRLNEFDDAVNARKQGNLEAAALRVGLNIGRHTTDQICNELALLRGLSSSSASR